MVFCGVTGGNVRYCAPLKYAITMFYNLLVKRAGSRQKKSILYVSCAKVNILKINFSFYSSLNCCKSSPFLKERFPHRVAGWWILRQLRLKVAHAGISIEVRMKNISSLKRVYSILLRFLKVSSHCCSCASSCSMAKALMRPR